VRASTETPGREKTYKVKRGDTLWDIARRFGTTTSTLRRLNDLGRSARIFVGQTIQIAGGGSLPDDYLIYIVRKGDTLSDIARAFQTSVESIKMLNGIGDAGKLKIGSQLKIAKE
jgi:LysM repeat protein